jgi:Fe-Mn family superoxide dismutase
MIHKLMALPYEQDAFEPHISRETLRYHHGKHHAGYIKNLNNLISGTKYEDMSLVEIIKNADGAIFNNAAQVYNHDFYWSSMTNQDSEISEELSKLIVRDFGTFDAFKADFIQKAITLFGSGWTWLCVDKDGKLTTLQTSNADNPLTHGYLPLLTCDIWEHAYYIDYRNSRADYIEKWWGFIDWDFVSHNLTKQDK